MRIIAGTARGTRLRAPEGLSVRPTSDRLREALFSSLGLRVPGARFLDACAGTGAVGLEALSRGAAEAWFFEPSPGALAALGANIATVRMEARSHVLAMPWERALERRALPELDLVYFDPPYGQGVVSSFLAAVEPFLRPDGLVLVEHLSRVPPQLPASFSSVKVLRAGRSAVTFVQASTSRRERAKIAGPCQEEE